MPIERHADGVCEGVQCQLSPVGSRKLPRPAHSSWVHCLRPVSLLGSCPLGGEAYVKTSELITQFHQRHRSTEFRRFLDKVDAAVPRHLIMDNYGTHKTPLIRNWFAKRPRFHVHFAPPYGPWLNFVERWFAALTKQLRRGTHCSVARPKAAIREFIDAHHANPKPFVWTKTADEILASIAWFAKRTLDFRAVSAAPPIAQTYSQDTCSISRRRRACRARRVYWPRALLDPDLRVVRWPM